MWSREDCVAWGHGTDQEGRGTDLGKEVGGGAVEAAGLLVHEEGALLSCGVLFRVCVCVRMVMSIRLRVGCVAWRMSVEANNRQRGRRRHARAGRTWMKSSREVMAEKMIM